MKNEILQTKRGRVSNDKIDTAKKDIEVLKSKLEKIETGGKRSLKWDLDDKNALKKSLEGLKKTITDMLANL